MRSVIKQNDRSVQKADRYVPNVDLGSSGCSHAHNMNYYKKSTMYSHLSYRGKLTKLSGIFRGGETRTIANIFKKTRITINTQQAFGTSVTAGGMFQGVAARQDTLLHASAIPWNLAVMKSGGVIPGTAQIKSSVTIDDALNVVSGLFGGGACETLDSGELRDRNSGIAKGFFKGYKENFGKIGYDLDACKTVYSGSKSTYLNEYYHDGRTMPVTVK